MSDAQGTSVEGQPKPEAQPDQVLNTFLNEFDAWSKDPKPEGLEPLKGHVAKYRETAEAAKKAAEAGKPVVPEKYNMVLPDKSLLDQAHLTSLAEIGKKSGWTQAQYDERVKEHHELIAKVQAADAAKLKALDETWMGQLKADPEFGGDKFAANSEKSKKFWEAVIPDKGVRDAIEAMGVMNYPPLVKAFVKAHDTFGIGEDDGVGGKGGNGGAPKTIEDRIGAYPDSKGVAAPV